MKVIIVSILLALATLHSAKSADLVIDREDYANRLQGFWLGSSIANWTGLPTENLRAEPPFFTDEDWQMPIGRDGQRVDFVLDDDPWKADDDTDIEYVYQRAMETASAYRLTPQEIADAWLEHIGLPLLWVSNLAALGQMQNGALPPYTSQPESNPMWEMIDAQLTTEIFGAFAPGRPDVALNIAHLPIHTTAHLHSAWAAEFYVIMHALVPLVDTSLSRGTQLRWMASEARKRIPDDSYIADMYDFVKAEFDGSTNLDDWESTRDKLYQRYQVDGAAGYRYAYPWDSGINFASSMVSLFYGDGDFKRTIRIGTLAGWDSDNPTATWGGLLGLLYGVDGLKAVFPEQTFSNAYQISRTRYNFPEAPDDIPSIARRGVQVIDRIVKEGMGGRIRSGKWVIPTSTQEIAAASTTASELNEPRRWQTIEDTDSRWRYKGFTTATQQWNASGATVTNGYSGCQAEIRFTGTAVRYYAHRTANSGTVAVTIDGEPAERVDLSSRNSDDRLELGQYYIKAFEKLDMSPGPHQLKIDCDDQATLKTIDMLSVRDSSE